MSKSAAQLLESKGRPSLGLGWPVKLDIDRTFAEYQVANIR